MLVGLSGYLSGLTEESSTFDGMGDVLKKHPLQLDRLALSSMAIAAMLVQASPAWSLSLGRLSVQSTLGESLKAEIDISSITPEEASSLKVRIASPEAYQAAGVDYHAVLPATQISLQRRGDRQFIVLKSDKSVQEPFVDLILELNWATGRLIREYTLLIDPSTKTATTKPEVSTPVDISSASSAAASQGKSSPASPLAPIPLASGEKPPASGGGDQTSKGSEYRVKPGETLSTIATRNLSKGISLDQMLVAIYRNNSRAFIDNNINRLKAGVVLNIPSADKAASTVTPAQAREVIQAQSADFRAYTERLASAAPKSKNEPGSRGAKGTVISGLKDKSVNPDNPDQLRLSMGGLAGQGKDKNISPEEKLSKDRQRQEVDSRIAELHRNIEEIKTIQSVTQKAPATSSATVPVPESAPTPTSEPAQPESTASATEGQARHNTSTPDRSGPAIVVDKPLPTPQEPVTKPEPQNLPIPSSESALTGTSLLLVIGGACMALLAGFGIFRLTRRGRKEGSETSFLESRLQPDSFFGASGGQHIDTRNEVGAASSMNYSPSQIDAMGDVDPVAEADVYLAYGRDLQAEEILKEAIRSDPNRLAIRTKLLEVYAKRRDTKSFEQLATQLFEVTQGQGDDWARAREMGAQIDPKNPLYGSGRPPAVSSPVVQENSNVSADEITMSQFGAAMDMEFDELNLLSSAPAPLASPQPPAPVSINKEAPVDSVMDLDFNLDLPDPPPAVAAPPAVSPKASSPELDIPDISLDFDDLNSINSTPTVPADADFPSDDDGRDPLMRKLELAEEFHQIGDTEGARDLLEEVVRQAADGPLKTKALALLDTIN